MGYFKKTQNILQVGPCTLSVASVSVLHFLLFNAPLSEEGFSYMKDIEFPINKKNVNYSYNE